MTEFAARHQAERDRVMSEWTTKWPLGSMWTHNTLGRVRVIEHVLGDNSDEEEDEIRVIGSLDVVDSTGKRWTCYTPGRDLSPETTIPAAELRKAAGIAPVGGGDAVEDCDALYDD